MADDQKPKLASSDAAQNASEVIGFLRPVKPGEEIPTDNAIYGPDRAQGGVMIWEFGNPNESQINDRRVKIGTIRMARSTDKPDSHFLYDGQLKQALVFEPSQPTPQPTPQPIPVAASPTGASMDINASNKPKPTGYYRPLTRGERPKSGLRIDPNSGEVFVWEPLPPELTGAQPATPPQAQAQSRPASVAAPATPFVVSSHVPNSGAQPAPAAQPQAQAQSRPASVAAPATPFVVSSHVPNSGAQPAPQPQAQAQSRPAAAAQPQGTLRQTRLQQHNPSLIQPYAVQISPDVQAIIDAARPQRTLISNAPMAGYSQSVVTLGKMEVINGPIPPTAARLQRRARAGAQPPAAMPVPPVVAAPAAAAQPAPVVPPVMAPAAPVQPPPATPRAPLTATTPMGQLSNPVNDNRPAGRFRRVWPAVAAGLLLMLASSSIGADENAQKGCPTPNIKQSAHLIHHKKHPKVTTQTAAAVAPPAADLSAPAPAPDYAPPAPPQQDYPPEVAQAPAYVQPADVQPAYVQPAYVQPAYVQPDYFPPVVVVPYGHADWRGPSERFIGGFRGDGYRHQIQVSQRFEAPHINHSAPPRMGGGGGMRPMMGMGGHGGGGHHR